MSWWVVRRSGLAALALLVAGAGCGRLGYGQPLTGARDGGGMDAARGDGGNVAASDAGPDAHVTSDLDADVDVDAGPAPPPRDAGPGCTTAADCDDGITCNGVESCVLFHCLPGVTLPCDDGVDCTNNACVEPGGCRFTPDDSRCTAAVDGRCNSTEGCQYPTCSPATCMSTACILATCMGAKCERTPRCGVGEMCCGDSCAPVGCDDSNPCTDDACEGSGCVHIRNTSPCEDGDACTVGDICVRGACEPGPPVMCAPATPCQFFSCDSFSGMCVGAIIPDGMPCTDSCGSGSCSSGVCATCAAGDSCCEATMTCAPTGSC